MDHASFDRVARLLGRASSRRAGLKALAGAFGLAALAPVDEAGAKDRHHATRHGAEQRKHPGLQGPCGDTTGPDNACTKDAQCCTGYCAKDAGGKSGRCRCIKAGDPCTKKQTCCDGSPCTNGICPRRRTCSDLGGACNGNPGCCGTLVCRNGTCKNPCAASGGACAANGDCCAGLECRKGICKTPCTPAGGSCATDANCCAGHECRSGTCRACAASSGTCSVNGDCCSGLECRSGTCRACAASSAACSVTGDCCGSLVCISGACGTCAALGGTCAATADCCGSNVCHRGTCKATTSVPTGQACVRGVDTCADAAASCIRYLRGSGGPSGTYCLLPPLDACTTAGHCSVNACTASLCCAGVGDACGDCDGCGTCADCCSGLTCYMGTCASSVAVATGAACRLGVDTCSDANASCARYLAGSGGPSGTYCLLPSLAACSAASECVVNTCTGNVCITQSCTATVPSPCVPTVCGACAYTTVQAGINAATDGDTLYIGAGTYTETITITGKSLALVGCPGGDVTITNANYDDRAITVTDGSNLELVNIVIAGYSDYDNSQHGGGIKTTSGDLSLCGATRIENGYQGSGGAVWFHASENPVGATLLITDATIIQDNDSDSYGCVFIDTYASVEVAGTAVFKNNTGQWGGALATKSYTRIAVSGSVEFSDNTASNDGAAIYWNGGGSAIDPTRFVIEGDGVFRGNVATNGSGGAINAYGCDPGGQELILRDNLLFKSNTGDDGGAIYSDSCRIIVSDDVAFIENTSTGSNSSSGGAIYFTDFTSYDDSYGPAIVTSDNVRFIGNTANGYGGAIYAEDYRVVLGDNTVIRGGSAGQAGGALSNVGYELSGSGRIECNTAPLGGGIYGWDDVEITGSLLIAGNTATTAGGGYHSPYAAHLTIGGTVEISGNSAPDGGGIAMAQTPFPPDTLTLKDDVRVMENIAANHGGGIWVNDANNTVTVQDNVEIFANTANGGASSGGGVYAVSNATTLTTTPFAIYDNTPDNCAGGTITC